MVLSGDVIAMPVNVVGRVWSVFTRDSETERGSVEWLMVDFASLFRSRTNSHNLDTVHRSVFQVDVTSVNIKSSYSQLGMVECEISTAVGRISMWRGQVEGAGGPRDYPAPYPHPYSSVS